MLDADKPVPNVAAKLGSYGNVFHNLLVSAAKRTSANLIIESENFDVVRGEYPRSASDFSALIISGSAASSYHDEEWIHKLDEYIMSVFANCPRVKIFGSCFGHQIVCQSILRKYGVVVEKNPRGWELGVHKIQLSEEFVNSLGNDAAFGCRPLTPDSVESARLSGPKTLRLQFIHADHVRIPDNTALPPTWITIGQTEECSSQGIYQHGRVLTYQGHFEFDRFINSETLKVFGARWDPDVLDRGLKAMDRDDDAEEGADILLFLYCSPAYANLDLR
ncbi:hypothetical protein C2857_003032 [Epichloe festucae Fl1]|uniref:Glutamine amidotransferase domain-containing protein n=1 Tax=Epichloe festucae (strain Fl1) TaxID=877507 RepID=A0A7U3Q1W3_EPIFF|nr:hypothetical protein C2857_003032 [Epichloe festucae Fl1]